MQTWLFVAVGAPSVPACLWHRRADGLAAGTPLSYGTLVVNVVGSFIMGLPMPLISHGHVVEHPMKPLLMVGILGALTTFSPLPSIRWLAQQGAYLKALLNIGLNLFLCLAMVVLGMQLVASRV